MASQPVAVVCRVLGAPRSSIYARRASAGARGRRKPRPHDGTIIPDLPNQRWGTDATMAWTRSDGWVWVFACVDHYSAEAWAHVAKVGDRFAALQPVHDAVIDRWGRLDADIARGLGLRHDWGPRGSRPRAQLYSSTRLPELVKHADVLLPPPLDAPTMIAPESRTVGSNSGWWRRYSNPKQGA